MVKLDSLGRPSRKLISSFRYPSLLRSIASTAGYNALSAIASGLAGILIARALGPAVRGEYAAITSWFGIVLIVGAVGQPAALCFHVARNPGDGPRYVATARVMMLITGSVATVTGVFLAPILAHGHNGEALGFRIAFSASIIAFVGASYTFALQATDLRRWNVARVSQPVGGLVLLIVLWRLHRLTLDTALSVLAFTMLIQLVWAYRYCRKAGLVPGKPQRSMVRPLGAYGVAQIAAVAPATLNYQLDQLVLSQTVPPGQLGRYAVAVSLTLIPIPFVSAIGNVVFPKLASQKSSGLVPSRLQEYSILGSLALTAALILPIVGSSYWLVPLIFGKAYSDSVPLVWVLAPGTLFLASGQVIGDLLRGRNRPLIVARAQGLAAILTVGILIALLPVLGVMGAAVASTISYGAAFAMMIRSLRNDRSVQGKHARVRGDSKGSVGIGPHMLASKGDVALESADGSMHGGRDHTRLG